LSIKQQYQTKAMGSLEEVVMTDPDLWLAIRERKFSDEPT